MTIIGGGDLVPPHRSGVVRRWLVTLVVLVLLAGAGYAAFLGLTGGGGGSKKPVVAPRPTCSPAPVAGPSSPADVHLDVFNGTLQSGLALQVATALKQRGFHVPHIGNTPRLATGVATVRYGAGQLLAAQAVALQIEGARLVADTVAGVQLDIGPRFHALRTPTDVRSAQSELVAAETASASPSPAAGC